MTQRILVDASVLFSRTLRDWLLIAQSLSLGMFACVWTEDILAETIHSVRRQNPHLDGAQLTAMRGQLVAAMSERIEAYPSVPLDGLLDPHDLHVHSAAVAGGVDMLVTLDKDFLLLEEAVTDSLTYEVIDPDSFLVLVNDSAPEVTRGATAKIWEYWRRRNPSTDLPERLRSAECPTFADIVEQHLHGMR